MTKGLEGVVATQSSITSIIDEELRYVGYHIDDLAEHSTFEEVVYLLWNNKLPNKEELENFKQQITANMYIPDVIIDHFRSYDLLSVHPMAALRTAVSFLGQFDKDANIIEEKENKKKAIKLQAQTAAIVAAFARIRKGKEPLKAKKELGYAANFLYMLTGTVPKDIEVQAFDKALVLHADHELNASTFAARVCVATLSDMYSGLTAAISTLKGTLHGGANESVMRMLMEIGEEENAIPFVKKKLDNKEVIMGMGHRVYRQGDPRTKHLKTMSKKLTELANQPKWYNISVAIEEYVKKEKGLPANVDFYSASVYHCLGIDHDIFTPVFAISRTSGWLAHILEQYANNRLIRPRADYIGPEKQTYIPIENRS